MADEKTIRKYLWYIWQKTKGDHDAITETIKKPRVEGDLEKASKLFDEYEKKGELRGFHTILDDDSPIQDAVKSMKKPPYGYFLYGETSKAAEWIRDLDIVFFDDNTKAKNFRKRGGVTAEIIAPDRRLMLRVASKDAAFIYYDGPEGYAVRILPAICKRYALWQVPDNVDEEDFRRGTAGRVLSELTSTGSISEYAIKIPPGTPGGRRNALIKAGVANLMDKEEDVVVRPKKPKKGGDE